MALLDKLFISGSWINSAVRYSNDSGTMLTAAQDAATGEALADEYSLVASAVSGGTATITVTTTSPNNPYGEASHNVFTGVALDSSTQYRNIVPGVILVFSSSTANGNTSTVRVGLYAGTFDAFGEDAGEPSDPVRHQVVNDGTGAVANAVARLVTQAIEIKTTGNVFAYIRPFAEGADEKLSPGSARTQPYHLGITGTAGSGGSKTANLQVDGVTLGAASILDLSSGLSVSGTALKAITPNYPYRIITGPLTGLEFALDPSCANGDIANVLIFPSQYIQIAPEVSGSPGTFGTTDVVLTQAGQAAGTIQPAGVAYYYTRIVVPPGATSESNPRPANVALSGTETGAANWRG